MMDTSKMIFVFGSNLAGKHGKGAALMAMRHHGAIYGIGSGLMNRCYALPTKWTPWKPMTIGDVSVEVSSFLSCAASHPELQFQVTQVGCGLAGHDTRQMAQLFHEAPANCFFDTAWQPILGDRHRYWGTHP